jgi:hypothetical protein
MKVGMNASLARPFSAKGKSVRNAILVSAMLLWIFAVGAGIRVLLRYSNTPGRLAAPQGSLPHTPVVRRERQRATLVAFLHPHCPCSRATIGELALIMARCQGRLNAYVFFYAPRSEGSVWARTDLWRDASAIPGVISAEDQDGTESRRFGASTSGQALLYDSHDRLVFNGGITASRGHAGANDGRDAVVSLLEIGTARHSTTPVFGCSLLGEE